MNWLWIVTIAILAAAGIAGLKAGLIKMIFSLVSTIAALVIAFLFSPAVNNVLQGSEAVNGFFTEKVAALVSSFEIDKKNPAEYIDSLPLPEAIKDVLRQDDETSVSIFMQSDTFEAYVCKRITDVVLNAVAFVITFLAAALALALLCGMLNILSRLPLLHQINKAAGLCAGLAEGVLIIWLFFVVLTMLAGTEFGKSAMEQISESRFLSYLYNNNLLASYILK